MLESIKSLYWRILEKCNRRKILVTPGDYLYIRDEIEFSQYIICSRIIDIENYSKNHIPTFDYSNALTRSQKIESFDATANDKRFENLLKSVEENGYQTKKRIAFNQQYNINDGTHRAAVAFTLGLTSIPSYYYPVPSHWGENDLKMLRYDEQFKPYRLDIEKRLLTIKKELREKGIACCTLITNVSDDVRESILELVSKYAKDVVIEMIDVQRFNHIPLKEKKSVIERPDVIKNGFLLHFLPKRYDFIVKNGKLEIQSMAKLGKLIKRANPQSVTCSSFVEGERFISAIKPYIMKQ